MGQSQSSCRGNAAVDARQQQRPPAVARPKKLDSEASYNRFHHRQQQHHLAPPAAAHHRDGGPPFLPPTVATHTAAARDHTNGWTKILSRNGKSPSSFADVPSDVLPFDVVRKPNNFRSALFRPRSCSAGRDHPAQLVLSFQQHSSGQQQQQTPQDWVLPMDCDYGSVGMDLAGNTRARTKLICREPDVTNEESATLGGGTHIFAVRYKTKPHHDRHRTDDEEEDDDYDEQQQQRLQQQADRDKFRESAKSAAARWMDATPDNDMDDDGGATKLHRDTFHTTAAAKKKPFVFSSPSRPTLFEEDDHLLQDVHHVSGGESRMTHVITLSQQQQPTTMASSRLKWSDTPKRANKQPSSSSLSAFDHWFLTRYHSPVNKGSLSVPRGIASSLFTPDAVQNTTVPPADELVCVDLEHQIYICDIGLTRRQCDLIVETTERCSRGTYAAYTYAKQTLGCREHDELAVVCEWPVMRACSTIRTHLHDIPSEPTTIPTTTTSHNNTTTTPNNSKDKATTTTTTMGGGEKEDEPPLLPKKINGDDGEGGEGRRRELVLDDREPHLVKYDVSKKERMKLDMHTDKSEWTFLIALSDGCGSDYDGGGTYYECIHSTVHIQKGHALIFPGKLRHCGQKITRGIRFLLVGFLVDNHHNSHNKCDTTPTPNVKTTTTTTATSTSTSNHPLASILHSHYKK